MTQCPSIKTKLPGPKSKAVIDRTTQYLSPSYTWAYPFAMKSGLGSEVEDMDGNRFLDFTSGIAVCSTGHSHPDVVKAIIDQSKQFLHMSGTDFYYESQGKLAEKLAAITPIKGNKKVFLANSGAEAIEGALKLARYHTKRKRIIAFLGAFHGRTLGALSLTASKTIQRTGQFPLLNGVTHTAYANCYRCPYNLAPDSCDMYCADWIEKQLFTTIAPPEEVAAIVVEPIQGEGGYIVPPKAFHQRLRAICDKYGILLIVDEVQSGMGRTGKMFAFEHFGIEPDIVCLAKGVASGMPLGAFIASDKIMNWTPGMHASTFGGNPVSCEAALATIKLLEDSLIQNAKEMGIYLKSHLVKMMDRYELIGDVRGVGLMVGVELVKNRRTKEKATDERNMIVQKCFEKGLLILGCGSNAVRFVPPLVITKDQIDVALKIFEETLCTIS